MYNINFSPFFYQFKFALVTWDRLKNSRSLVRGLFSTKFQIRLWGHGSKFEDVWSPYLYGRSLPIIIEFNGSVLILLCLSMASTHIPFSYRETNLQRDAMLIKRVLIFFFHSLKNKQLKWSENLYTSLEKIYNFSLVLKIKPCMIYILWGKCWKRVHLDVSKRLYRA